ASGKKTAELQTDSGAPRGCTPDKASRLPDRNRADYRGWGERRGECRVDVARPASGALSRTS
ncbi:hypothetical protein ABVT39_009307, partial [Epinephelus coioides]